MFPQPLDGQPRNPPTCMEAALGMCQAPCMDDLAPGTRTIMMAVLQVKKRGL